MKTQPHTLAGTVIGAIALALPVGQATACDACNLAFADEILTGERSESMIAKDLRRAMENQKGLPVVGTTKPMLLELQEAKLRNPARTLLITNPAPTQTVATEPAATAAPAPATPASAVAAAATRELPEYMKEADFIEIIERDYALETTPYSTVPQDAPHDKSFTIRLHEGKTYLGNGVVYDGFLIDGKIPGPTLIVDEGDVVEFNVANEGMIPHGASIHSAYTQTSKYVGQIMPGTTKTVKFRAMTPGVYMYHCAPGGHAIPMHVMGGQYGMMVVRPAPGSYRLEKELGHPPDVELFLTQHELYASGKNALSAEADYTMFNGRLFRYVEEPIVTRPGDYVRINFLNVGPNHLSTFHIVGIIWDYIYWQGHPEAILPGGQTVTAGPSDSFVIEFRVPPDTGSYTMLSHKVRSSTRGAIGLIVADDEAELEPHRTILSDGPDFTKEELETYIAEANRVIAPFGIGTHPVDRPVRIADDVKETHVSITGNSYHPKVIEIAPGTKVTWTNEDVFTYLGGEFSGIHNSVAVTMPEGGTGFVTPMLMHAESGSHVFETPGEYDYICAPHPYMKGKIIVREPAD